MRVLFTCKYERDMIKKAEINCRHRFTNYSSNEMFSCPWAANFITCGQVFPKFDVIYGFMNFLVSCKFAKYLINSNEKTGNTSNFGCSRAGNSVVSGLIRLGLLVIMWFLFGEVFSSPWCMGWAWLFYCGTT